MVARAWVDPDYRARLLSDGSAAIAELGFGGVEGEHMVVVENTPDVHNVIVCTLCSCYPWPVLGLPPTWYKSEAYRARVVAEPRRVLGEFGLELDPDVELRVWDSSAEVRYLVLPERPEGTDGLSEEQLAALVTRDAMIGVAARSEAPGVSTPLAEVDAQLSGYAPLPRANGELVFDEVWHGRALGMGVVVLERLGPALERVPRPPRRGDRAPRPARGRDGRRGLLRRVPGRDRVAGGRRTRR